MRTELMTASAGIVVAGVVVNAFNVIVAVWPLLMVALETTPSIACAAFGFVNWLLVVFVGFHVLDTGAGGVFTPFG
jgi:hypothetical protein